MFFWANRLDFWQSCRYFLPKIEIFFAVTPKIIRKTLLSSKEIFFCQNDPQCSKKAISKNLPKNLRKSQKMTKRVLEHQELWWNLTPEYVIFSLVKAAKSFLSNFPEFFCSESEEDKRLFLLYKIISFSKCSILAKFFAENLKHFCSDSEIQLKTLLCSKKLFFSQNDPQRSKKKQFS